MSLPKRTVDSVQAEARRAQQDFLRDGIFQLADIRGPADICRVQSALQSFGLLFITGALDETQKQRVEQLVLNATRELPYEQLHVKTVCELAQRLTEPHSATGIIAAKQTGMLNCFPPTRRDACTVPLAGASEPVDRNPWYAGVNVKLLEEHPGLCAVLSVLGTDDSGLNVRKLSEDSVKVAHKANPSTALHIDHYENARERLQACLHVRGGARELGYLPMTRKLELLLKAREPDLYASYGLKRLSGTDLLPYCVAPDSGTVAVWISGVPHGEQLFGGAEHSVRRPCAEADRTDHTVLRLYIGTHAADLSLPTLRRLAELAHTGLTPSRFHKAAPDTPVQRNKMSTGTTGAYNSCKRSASELADVCALAQNTVPWHSLNPVQKQLAGIVQPLSTLPPHFRALLTDEQQQTWNAQATAYQDDQLDTAMPKPSTSTPMVHSQDFFIRDGFVAAQHAHDKRMVNKV